MDSLNFVIKICHVLITIFTCISMGNVLTSGDLHVGHNDLGPCILVDPTEANIETSNTA